MIHFDVSVWSALVAFLVGSLLSPMTKDAGLWLYDRARDLVAPRRPDRWHG